MFQKQCQKSTSFPGLFSAEATSPRRRKALGTRLVKSAINPSHLVPVSRNFVAPLMEIKGDQSYLFIQLMVSGSRRMSSKLPDFKLSLLGHEIIPAQTVKDLGVIFDPTLYFDNHISATVSSCMSKLSKISRIRFAFF